MRAILPIIAKVSAQPAPRQLCWSCHPGFQDLRSPEWEVAGNRNSRVERVAARQKPKQSLSQTLEARALFLVLLVLGQEV